VQEDFGQAEVPAAAGGGVASGQRDLRGDAAVDAGVALLSGGLRCGLRGGEDDGEFGLRGSAGGLHSFQLGDLVDEFGVGGGVVHGCESVDELGEVVGGQHRPSTLRLAGRHVFDYTSVNREKKALERH